MRQVPAEAGPSSPTAPNNLSLLPSNVLTVFLARFHVRHGNQIEYQYPPAPAFTPIAKHDLIDIDDTKTTSDHALDLSGVEWKVLPSGGHLIEKDVIYFETRHKGTTGVACFRNLKLDTTADANAAATQRGASMVSVGLILRCQSHPDQQPTSLSQQLAIVPHLFNLGKIADQLVHSPQDTSPLQSYYETHRPRTNTSGTTTLDGRRMKQLRMRRRRDPKNLPHDPISHMPALSGSLGALLPHLLKKLMLPHHRLLIFSPSPPLVHAAHIGFNLADLVALAVGRVGKRHENLQSFASKGIITVRGQIGVHDITQLEEEENKASNQDDSTTERRNSWIAWTSDKILLEKPWLFDSVLDLSPLITRDSHGVLNEAALENTATGARLLTVIRPFLSANSAEKPRLKVESWTTREFATFNELDVQASRHAERVSRLGPSACVSRRKSKSRLSRTASSSNPGLSRHNSGDQHTNPDAVTVAQWRGSATCSRRSRGMGTLSAILAFLRYWLAGWWFLPSQWRYGLPAAYVLPLGIRGDGGVRASILVMPEDESDDDDDSNGDLDEEEDREIALEDEQREEERERRSNAFADDAVGEMPCAPDDAAATVVARRAVDRIDVDQNPSTNSSSTDETDDGPAYPNVARSNHHHLIPPDPLLAAVGASPLRSESDRLSLSHHSLRRRSTDRSLSQYARSFSSHADGFEDPTAWTSMSTNMVKDELQDRFHTILSDSLWMVWSHWTTALVCGVLDILEDRLAQMEIEEDGDETSVDSEEVDLSALLVTKLSRGLVLELAHQDMASLGLSVGNKVDVEVVECLGSTCLNLLTSSICQGKDKEPKVVVRRGWSLFRWLL
ncbi:uncharacterized protein MEPE_02390 [Melanopsichium pennsylvanicum]|uniref:Uncharacterized protein n=2 Tax=Melanopsichium pennsylvanicum TaxID=63383 RepID=A0AAJ5C4M4_9BASI|nr:conserved hypothetical protein [Melanopsichium pennsylvanicum 4]SNX83683.1 uncharacterized protein MEPE_02390 [Melanopsichium pennsylvanicum]